MTLQMKINYELFYHFYLIEKFAILSGAFWMIHNRQVNTKFMKGH